MEEKNTSPAKGKPPQPKQTVVHDATKVRNIRSPLYGQHSFLVNDQRAGKNMGSGAESPLEKGDLLLTISFFSIASGQVCP